MKYIVHILNLRHKLGSLESLILFTAYSSNNWYVLCSNKVCVFLYLETTSVEAITNSYSYLTGLVWDEKSSTRVIPGLMGTDDEETQKFFRDKNMDIELVYRKKEGPTLSVKCEFVRLKSRTTLTAQW